MTAATAAGPARAPWSGTSGVRCPARPAPPSRRSAAGSRATSRTRSRWPPPRARPRAARRSPGSGGSTARRSRAPRAAHGPRRGGAAATPRSGPPGRGATAGRRDAPPARGRRRSPRGCRRRPSPRRYVPGGTAPTGFPRTSVTLQDRVVGEVLEERLRAGAEAELGAAAGRDRDHDVADVRGVDREAEAAQRVEVVQADPLELRVAAEDREVLQRADRAGVLGPELRKRLDDEVALVLAALQVTGGELVAVAAERQRGRAVHVQRAG